MSTKISNLPQRLGITGNPNDNSISGEEFFPIVDVQNGINQTFRIDLKELFNTNGVEKVTGLSVTQGRVFDDDVNGDDGNKFFTLEYIDEASVTHSIKIQKYVIEDNDVAFSHIDPAGYITSSEKIEDNLIDNQLTTPKAVDDHVTHRENLLFTNTDSLVKTYFGDEVEGISTFVDGDGNTVLRTPADSEYTRTGSHVLQHFRLSTEVAQDFVNLLDGVKPELDTFKKIEEEFDTIDYSDKIGTSQVNLNQFRIDDSGGEPLFPNRLNIKELAIGTGLITNNAITTNKILAAAVTGSKIAQSAISNDQIVGLTITEDKIVNATISHLKLSSGSPEWNTTNVNIPNNLSVTNNAIVGGNITQSGATLSIYNATSRGTGDLHGGRALVHEEGDRLSINHESDYTGGVNIRGVVTVQDMSEANILAGGEQAIVTKAYVDKADINLNPIGSDKIQDNAILLRHMTDDSVGTAEILDDSITTFKIENIGPQWDQTGKVQVSGNLAVAGTNATIGDPSSGDDKSEIIIRGPQSSGNLQRGFASISRNSGSTADLSFKNVDGDITFSSSASAEVNFRLTTSRVFIPRTLTVSATGSTSIEGTNFTNPALLIGTASDGIAIDNTEIVQKGGNLNLGVANSDQDIQFRSASNTVTTIDNSGNITTGGDFISTTGNFKNVEEVGALTLDTDGAKIALNTLGNPLGSANAFYNATEHRFFNRVGNQEILKIDTSNRKVTLFNEGTNPNHLITKGYVDTKKIAPSDLTTGGPNWQSNGTVETENSLYVNSTGSGLEQESVGVFSRNVYGQRGDSSDADHTYLRLKGSVNPFSAQITINSREHASDPDNIEIRGSRTQIRNGSFPGSPLALDIQEDGKITAPQQSISRIISSSRSLTTKEYVLEEIAKVHPDLSYVSASGDEITGAHTISGTVDPGAAERSSSTYARAGTNLLLKGSSEGVSGIFFQSEENGTNINHASDFGYIQYHAHGYGNTTAEQSDLVIGVTNDSSGVHIDKLVIDVPGNKNFVLTPDNGTTEHQIWHAGNDGSGSGLDADLLDGKHGSHYLNTANLIGNIPDSKLPNVITPITSVTTREIKTSTSQELILNAGESSGKISGQTNEYVYVNAEQGLSVNTPKSSNRNWVGGVEIDTTIIKGNVISVGGVENIVWHNGNTDSIITTAKLKNDAVTSSKIAPISVVTDKIANANVTTIKIKDLNVTSAKIADGAITSSKLPAKIITTDKIANLTITGEKLLNKIITSDKLVDNAVITSKIADLNVTTGKLVANAVTNSKLGTNAVTRRNIMMKAVGRLQIDDGEIITSKIATNAVTSDKIPDNSIDGSKFLDNSITSAKLLDNSITTSKITNLVISNRHIATSAVTASKIAANAVGASEIAANAVGPSEIAANAVGSSEIASGAVGTSEIADNSVTEAKLSHVTAGFLLGKGHGEASAAPNLVPIATSVTSQSKHNSVPSVKAVKAYVDAEVGKPKGKLYHVNAIQKSRAYFLAGGTNTANNIFPNSAVFNYARSILPNLKAGDRVMVTWGYLTTTAQNGTSYAFQYAQTIYAVNSSTSWTAMHHGTVI